MKDVALNHDEWLCLNCGWRPANDIRPEVRIRLKCYYCAKRAPDLERSNLACGECLDRQKHYESRQAWARR